MSIGRDGKKSAKKRETRWRRGWGGGLTVLTMNLWRPSLRRFLAWLRVCRALPACIPALSLKPFRLVLFVEIAPEGKTNRQWERIWVIKKPSMMLAPAVSQAWVACRRAVAAAGVGVTLNLAKVALRSKLSPQGMLAGSRARTRAVWIAVVVAGGCNSQRTTKWTGSEDRARAWYL